MTKWLETFWHFNACHLPLYFLYVGIMEDTAANVMALLLAREMHVALDLPKKQSVSQKWNLTYNLYGISSFRCLILQFIYLRKKKKKEKNIFVSIFLLLQHFKNNHGINKQKLNSILWYHSDTYIILQAQKLSNCTGSCHLRKWVTICTDKYSKIWEPPGSGKQWRSFPLPPASLTLHACSCLTCLWFVLPPSGLLIFVSPNQSWLPLHCLRKVISYLPLWHSLCFCNSRVTSPPPLISFLSSFPCPLRPSPPVPWFFLFPTPLTSSSPCSFCTRMACLGMPGSKTDAQLHLQEMCWVLCFWDTQDGCRVLAAKPQQAFMQVMVLMVTCKVL